MALYRVIRNDYRGFNNLPPRSPDTTPCDLFLCGYVKDLVYVPPLPASIPELKVRIRIAIETITAFSRCNPMRFISMWLRQGSGLCSSSSCKYPGNEGTNQNRH